LVSLPSGPPKQGGKLPIIQKGIVVCLESDLIKDPLQNRYPHFCSGRGHFYLVSNNGIHDIGEGITITKLDLTSDVEVSYLWQQKRVTS
jgi:hypothetical protein